MVTALDKNTALVLIDFQNSVVKLQLAKPASEFVAYAVKLVNALDDTDNIIMKLAERV